MVDKSSQKLQKPLFAARRCQIRERGRRRQNEKLRAQKTDLPQGGPSFNAAQKSV